MSTPTLFFIIDRSPGGVISQNRIAPILYLGRSLLINSPLEELLNLWVEFSR
ncbi:MAG: hypothetical protein V7K38_21265 [Nostoc sp.]|uniref:hypothetical protein n=1 Tax=Nostoc sp. TaxID=1180 RepID=UPI002FF58F99